MSPFDIAVFTFFILVTIKAASDTVSFWKSQEEEAKRQYVAAARRVRKSARVTPLRAPVRKTA